MRTHEQTINKVLSSIDWKKIKSYHVKLGIKWEFEEDKQTVQRNPTIPELRAELQSILDHMAAVKLDYISYANWVVFWERTGSEDIRVIFRLVDYSFGEPVIKGSSKETLESALQKAIENEDYEYAAMLRDEINNTNKDANNNIK